LGSWEVKGLGGRKRIFDKCKKHYINSGPVATRKGLVKAQPFADFKNRDI
jgi:hypothetical protein